MRKLFVTILLHSILSLPALKAEETTGFELPELPTTNLNKIDNELSEYEETPRSPSSNQSEENEYLEPEKETSTWDYQNIIDRHDKH